MEYQSGRRSRLRRSNPFSLRAECMPDLNQERDLLRRRLLGWDLATAPVLPGADIGRDLVLTAGPAIDFQRVVGMDNLAQALTHALTTRLGDDVFNTTYGFDGLNAI